MHSVVGTAANVNDVTQASKLLHGEETDAWGDAGYQGVDKREEFKDSPVRWEVAMRPGKRRALEPERDLHQLLEKADVLPPLLVTFGLSVIIQNALLMGYSADPQKLQAGPIETASVSLGPITLGVMPVLVFAVAVAVIAGLQWMFYRTALGRAFRATSDRQDIAQLMGLNRAHVFGLAMALSLAVTALAGVFLGIRTSFDPAAGASRLIFGFEAVIIGGLGNLWGTLGGGVILGIAQTLGAKINPGYQILAGHLVFLLILAIRPRGLFPRMDG